MPDIEAPEVTARVEETWAAMEVDGETQTIRADSEEEVRSELLRRTQQIAVDAGSDVRLVTTDRDGEWRIVVSPDGDISETAEPTSVHGAHNATGEIPVATTDDTSRTDSAQDAPEPGIADDDTLVPGADDHAVSDATTTDSHPGDADRPADAATDRDEEPSAASFYGAWPADTVTISPPPGPATVESVADDERSVAEPPTAERPIAEVRLFGAPHVEQSEEPAKSESSAQTTQFEWTAAVDQSAHAAQSDQSAQTVQSEQPEQTAPAATADAVAAPPLAASDPPPTAATISGPPRVIAPAAAMPTLADFRATQPPPVEGPAQQGWQGAVRRGTAGLITPKPGPTEVRHRQAIASVTRGLDGPRTICVVNPKGGAHKTTATMLIAATFGMHRGGYTLAWDNNESRGTLGWRAHQARHTNTAVDLLADMDRFTDPRSARVGDLDNYVRSQADAQFDVLASDEDAAATSEIDGAGFDRLHETLQRFYRIIVVDTGNNMRASNWEAAVAAADQLVIVSAMREDTAGSAAWMVEGLARKGHEDKLRSAVTVLSAPDKTTDAALRGRLFDHFGSLTRTVIEVPYDPTLVSGAGITIGAIAPATREAWLMATAKIAEGL